MNARAWDGTLKAAGLWSQWLLMLITWNLEFAPHQDSERRNTRDIMGTIYHKQFYWEVQMFEAWAPDIINEFETHNVHQFDHSGNLSQQLWEYLSNENRNGNMDRRAALNRFGAGVAANRRSQGLWTKWLFERSTLSLESDIVTNVALAKIQPVKPGAPEAGSDGGSTNPKLLQLADKSSLAGMANAVATSMLTLQNSNMRRTMAVINPVGKVFNKWQEWMQDLTKSAEGTSKYIRRNANGGFTAHLCEYLSLLTNVDALIDATFTVPGINVPDDLSRRPDLDYDTCVENELANVYGDLILGAMGEKGYRGLFVESFPYSVYECLEGKPDDVI